MKPLYDSGEKDSHKASIKCIRCGETGFADKEYCAICGAKYPLKAVIVDFDIPFGSLVRFIVKLAFAAIPAAFTIAVVFFFLKTSLSNYLAYFKHHPIW